MSESDYEAALEYEAAIEQYEQNPFAVTAGAIGAGQAPVIAAALANVNENRQAEEIAVNTASLAISNIRRENGAEVFDQYEPRIRELIDEHPGLIPDAARYDVEVAERALANVWKIADQEAHAARKQSIEQQKQSAFEAIKGARVRSYWESPSS